MEVSLLLTALRSLCPRPARDNPDDGRRLVVRGLPGGHAKRRLHPHGRTSRPPSPHGDGLRSNVLAIFMLYGGVFFTVVAVAAWTTGRRVGGMFLAMLAGINVALAIELLMRFFKK
jgi:hypothetical protein